MNTQPLTIAYITAGGAGMYCGSCMRDNSVAAAMHRAGQDIHLIPTYTPIRTDEENVSDEKVFYGGINVYLEQTVPGYRFLPGFLTRWLDSPRVIRWATSGNINTDAKQLGALTLSMLKGTEGNQRKEALRLVSWLTDSIRPDVINLSNMLIAGCLPAIKKKLDCPVIVTLQGDDIFMNDLAEPFKQKCLTQIRELVPYVDQFIVFSQYYADYMAELFGIPPEKFSLIPLGIETADLPLSAAEQRDPINGHPPTIGYLARLAPEKGLHQLVDAFIQLKRQPEMHEAQLKIAGWLGAKDQAYADHQFKKLQDAGLESSFEYAGSVDRSGKLEFLQSLDVLSVPTVYREPKGLFVLEALAAGVPVVQPQHGAFPEMISATGGGILVPPEDVTELAKQLSLLLSDRSATHELGLSGCRTVHQKFNSAEVAQQTVDLYRKLLAQ
ncbi:MAG: glycosyltransferase family 4 protein [Pirellulales bacterium]|jgi:glycosyltransferase involved in cell wall biosynthesis